MSRRINLQPRISDDLHYGGPLETSCQAHRTRGNMLTKLIVALYAWLLETALWSMLTLAGFVGYHVTIPIMNEAGAVLTPEFAWKILGALVFPVITFLILAVIIGPLLILVDVRQAVRNIEARLERGEDVSKSRPIERRDPS